MMPFDPSAPPESVLKELFASVRSIAVIGLSPVPSRPSYGVTSYLIESGFEIYGVRPKSPPLILDRPCYDHLTDLTRPIDLVDVFRQSDAVPAVVEDIAQWFKAMPKDFTKPRYLWIQEGIRHPEAEERAVRELGLTVIADRCILKDHRRLA